ncbi:MAG: flavodoxin domain-containing protein [Pseudobdellovibrio sp.]
MSRILVVYASNYGQTKKIAESMAAEIQTWGHGAHLVDGNQISNELNPAEFDAVIIGASVNRGHYSRNLRKWVKAYAACLTEMPSAFFSVCLGILQNDEAVQADEIRIVDDFFKMTHWQPSQRIILAGALKYSQYNFLLKWLMKRIADKAGFQTNTNQDYVFTDWNQVQTFTRNFCKNVVLPT